MAARAAIIEENLDSLLVQAAIAAKTRSFDDAKTLYQNALARGPSSAAHFGLGELYLSAQQFVLASEQLALAATLAPTEAHIQLQLGRALLATDRLDEALPHLEKAMKLSPEQPGAYDAVVTVMLEYGLVADAERVLRNGLILMPNQPLLRVRLSDVLVAKGTPGEALAIALELTNQYPKDIDLVINAARLLAATGSRETAHGILRVLNEQGLATCESRELEGQLFEAEGKPNDALLAYVGAAKADFRDWRALNNLAHLLMRKEEGDEAENLSAAREALEEARRRAPARLEPALNLALVAAREKKTDEARSLAEEVAAKASLQTQRDLAEQAKHLLKRL